jgi:hypothetical protein
MLGSPQDPAYQPSTLQLILQLGKRRMHITQLITLHPSVRVTEQISIKPIEITLMLKAKINPTLSLVTRSMKSNPLTEHVMAVVELARESSLHPV